MEAELCRWKSTCFNVDTPLELQMLRSMYLNAAPVLLTEYRFDVQRWARVSSSGTEMAEAITGRQ